MQAGGVTFASVRIPINQNIGQRRIRNAFLTSQVLPWSLPVCSEWHADSICFIHIRSTTAR